MEIPFFNVNRTETARLFTEQEFQELYKRFGHPRAEE